MPIKKYFLWVGGVLLSIMLALDAYLPNPPPRKDYDFDRTGLKISAPDTGIAPDTGAVALGMAQDTASETPDATKVAPSTAPQSLGRLEPDPPKRPQHKRSARLQTAKPINPVTQPAWSSQWTYNWSSQRSYNWSANPGLRGSIANAPRSSPKRQVSKPPADYSRSRNWKFNFAGAGQNDSCWGC
jgi:hypothetical protein